MLTGIATGNANTAIRKAAIEKLTDQKILAGTPGAATGAQAINEPEAAEAMRLCDEAGIDMKKKRIWKDREKIPAGLKAGELKNWLMVFAGRQSG